jgi:dCTP deaminase
MMLSGNDIAAAYLRWKTLQDMKEELGADFVPDELGGPGSNYNGEENVPIIGIDPFEPGRLNPNSYNLTLHEHLKVYNLIQNAPVIREFSEVTFDDTRESRTDVLDVRQDTPTVDIKIPEEGWVLQPGVLYLGRTVEYTESWNCVPGIAGRSSTGRLGLSIHETAGFGDVGFCGTWTLEIVVTHPVRVYAGMECCQICYHTVSEDHVNYKGRYLGQKDPTASRLHQGDESAD